MGQIDQAFSSIYNMFGGSGSNLSGGGSGGFGLSPQPVSGADNSVTAGQRASMNLLGQMGGQSYQTGQGLISGGTGIAGGGVDIMGTGLNTIQPSIDFYNKLISGDPTTMTAALAPTAANLSTIYSGATDQASRGMPAGGYRASTLANLPFAQAQQVGNAALALQPQAAQALAALGQEQAGIGQGIAGVGTQLGQLGTTLTGQGQTSIQSLASDLLQKQRINQLDPTIMDQISQALGIAGTAASAIGGGISGAGLGGIFSGIGKGISTSQASQG